MPRSTNENGPAHLQFFVVNLDGSTERWDAISRSADAAGLALARVPGTLGRAVPRTDWIDVDEQRFRLANGRSILAGEYGCYRSHLAALDAFIDTGDAVGVVCEDDIVLNGEASSVVAAVLDARPDLDLLKLVNHRVKGFRRHGGEGRATFGRCLHGPQGSAAAYAVTRQGALLLRQRLETMWLPYDVALERGWALGARVYTLRNAAFRFQPTRPASLIETAEEGGSYRRSKAPLFMRTPTALFRASDYGRRMRYALAR